MDERRATLSGVDIATEATGSLRAQVTDHE
jgi:hypothetical protein